MVRLKSIRERLIPRGQTQLSYHDLMLAMCDVADTTSMLRSNGKRHFIFIFLLACIIGYHAVAVSTLMINNSRHLRWGCHC